jgi:hypothetical protein
MIFGRDRVSCDDFGDCHNEIAIAGGQFVVLIYKEWDASRSVGYLNKGYPTLNN